MVTGRITVLLTEIKISGRVSVMRKKRMHFILEILNLSITE